MDRTIATGTGYIGQYPPEVQKMYEWLATCPDNLVLFFHHIALHERFALRKRTVIQYVYDSHYDRSRNAAREFIREMEDA